MAQLEKKQRDLGNLVRRLVRGRPWLAGIAAVLALALIGVSAAGVLQAGEGTELVIDHTGGSGGDSGSAYFELEADDGDDGPDSELDATAGDDGEPEAPPATIMVDVDGAVATPQVVTLPADARVNDAIEAAGGLTPDADASGINRAALLADGQKVYVPRQGEVVTGAAVSGGAGASASGSGATADGTGASGTGTSTTSGAGALVNINTADIETLDTLPGVGPATAQAIVDDRTQNGSFASIEDIMRVSGIGEKKFEKLKDLICV